MIAITGETDVERLLSDFDDSIPGSTPTVPQPSLDEKEDEKEDETAAEISDLNPAELIIDQKTGEVRQAGAMSYHADFVNRFKSAAEADLFTFSKVVMGRSRLTRRLHLPICQWLQDSKKSHKLLLLPRGHYKTSIVSQSLPFHIHIQPKERNIYFPDKLGRNIRIMLGCETLSRSASRLRWIKAAWENNQLLRTLWPQCSWEKPKAQAGKWSENEIIIPREIDFPEPSIQAIGVDGAITGAHQECHIKDDLISLAAANSPIEMHKAIEWNTTSEALLDIGEVETEYRPLAFTIGTRWAVYDLYHHIQLTDTEVSVLKLAIIWDGEEIIPEGWEKAFSHFREGQRILPEQISADMVNELKHKHGDMYPLLYKNSAVDSSLVAFNKHLIRDFILDEQTNEIVFESDERDVALESRLNQPAKDPDEVRGALPLNKDTYSAIFPRRTQDEYLERKYIGRGERVG